jgi:hypothetical protein
MSNNSPPLLLISFFCGIRGNCPAEWADDKIRVLEAVGREVIVLTGMGSHTTNRKGIRFVRVASLSWNDYKEELKELKRGGEVVSIGMILFMPLAFFLGIVFDFVLLKVTNGLSAGRWSWFITALPVALLLKIRYGVRDIFCTGGPMSAQLIGWAVVSLTNCRLFCEFQDPLLGATMTRSSLTRRIATRFEAWLAECSTRAVYVTYEAAKLARQRHPDQAHKIIGVYPGAWKFFPPVSQGVEGKCEGFEFLHLGTLYGSRNLDLFFEALDALRNEGFEIARTVRVVNLGAVYCETASRYLARPDFQSLDALDRVDALKRAQRASCLMLVQHTDERSRETIPYKTYDYLNLGLPVFGILNNQELKVLIEWSGGHAAEADNMEAIKLSLQACLLDLVSEQTVQKETSQNFDISRQFLQVLESVDGGR